MKKFGTKLGGIILMVNEDELTLGLIRQIKNYLDAKEKQIKNSHKQLKR